MSQPEPIRVGILDDEAIVASSMAAWLRENATTLLVTVVGTHADEICARTQEFDVLLLDVGLHEGDSTAAEVAACMTREGIPCLLVSALHGGALVRDALVAGATSYLSKSAEPELLVERLVQVATGSAPLTPEMASIMLQNTSAGLSPREIEVLRLYTQGLLTKQVARLLGIEASTVESHLKRIRRKFERAGRPARTRSELQAVGIADGLIDAPPRTA